MTTLCHTPSWRVHLAYPGSREAHTYVTVQGESPDDAKANALQTVKGLRVVKVVRAKELR